MLNQEIEKREEINATLGVMAWRRPGASVEPTVMSEDGVPSWWQGDEEASAEFFRAMRIDPNAV